jgi:hypothetical protein
LSETSSRNEIFLFIEREREREKERERDTERERERERENMVRSKALLHAKHVRRIDIDTRTELGIIVNSKLGY